MPLLTTATDAAAAADDDDDEVSVVLDAEDTLASCREFITLLRREEFGVNVELSEDGRRLMDKQQERLGRSLERLSKDLYSKDTHFVLELVQNADDNAYPPDMLQYGLISLPYLTFRQAVKPVKPLNITIRLQ